MLIPREQYGQSLWLFSGLLSPELNRRTVDFKNVEGGDFKLDKSHARIVFSTAHFWVNLNGLGTNDSELDENLKPPDYFDVAKSPDATFKSTKPLVGGRWGHAQALCLQVLGVDRTRVRPQQMPSSQPLAPLGLGPHDAGIGRALRFGQRLQPFSANGVGLVDVTPFPDSCAASRYGAEYHHSGPTSSWRACDRFDCLS